MHSKELVLGALTVIAGVTNAYLWKGVLFAGGVQHAAFYLVPVFVLFIFSILFALSALFIRYHLVRIATAVIAHVSGYLLIPFTATIGVAAVFSGIGGWIAVQDIAKEETASQTFSMRKILKSGMPLFFTALALLFSVFYYSFAINHSSQGILPKSLFNAAVPYMEKPIQGFLPGYRNNATVDDLLLAFATQQFGSSVDIKTLTPAEKAALLAQGREALRAQFGIKLTGKEKASDVLSQVTNSQIEKFAGANKQYLPIAAAIGFFIAIKALTLPVFWITLILTGLMVQLMLKVGIVKREKVMVEIEKVNL